MDNLNVKLNRLQQKQFSDFFAELSKGSLLTAFSSPFVFQLSNEGRLLAFFSFLVIAIFFIYTSLKILEKEI